MLIIYGADLSSPANKVRFAANALGLQYDYKRISIRDGENKTAEFLKIHPAGKIPAIDDNGFVLFESDAIIQYLAQQESSPLYPADLKQRAIVHQWMYFTAQHVAASMAKVTYNRIFVPRLKLTVDERSIQDGINFLNRFLPIVDNQLGKSPYLAGAALTLADISLLAALDPAEISGIDLSAYAHITKWRNALKQKDFYSKCHKEYGESLKQFAAK